MGYIIGSFDGEPTPEDLRMIALVLATDVYDVGILRGNFSNSDGPEVTKELKNLRKIPYTIVYSGDLKEEANTLGLSGDNQKDFANYLDEKEGYATKKYRRPVMHYDEHGRVYYIRKDNGERTYDFITNVKAIESVVKCKLSDSGYKVQLYKWNYTKSIEGFPQYVIAFGGTDGLLNPDLLTDLDIGFDGEDIPQLNYAKKLGQTLKNAKASVLFTGHSLGGGLAACCAVAQGNGQAITFNAVGLPTNYSKGYTERFERTDAREQDILSLLKEAKPLIFNYFMKHDPLTFFQSKYGRDYYYGITKNFLYRGIAKSAIMLDVRRIALYSAILYLVWYIHKSVPKGAAGNNLCIDDDDFTIEGGDVANKGDFSGGIRNILESSDILDYAQNINDNELQHFDKKCQRAIKFFREFDLGDLWVAMYQKYHEYYAKEKAGKIPKEIAKEALKNSIRDFMARSLVLYHLAGVEQLKPALTDAKNYLHASSSYLQYQREEMLFGPIMELLDRLRTLMEKELDPYADFKPVGNDHKCVALLPALAEYLEQLERQVPE